MFEIRLSCNMQSDASALATLRSSSARPTNNNWYCESIGIENLLRHKLKF